MYQESVRECEDLLTETEPQLRSFIQDHELTSQLIDEDMLWVNVNDKIKFHQGDLQEYTFEKHLGGHFFGPALRRGIRWYGQDNLHYIIEIFADASKRTFTLGSTVSLYPFGAEPPVAFRAGESLELPLKPELLRQLLENKFKLLVQEAAKISTQPSTPGV